MTITDRNLEAGTTTLVARFKGKDYICQVAEVDGAIRYLPASGSDFIGPTEGFKSPSGAGSAITGQACNGWVFWSVEGSEEAKPKVRGRKANSGNHTPNLALMKDGRWFCSACQEAFAVTEGFEPEECPQGHPQTK